MKILNSNTIGNITFTRAIRPDEKKDYGDTIAEGKKFLGIENLAIILHGSSFPQADKDLFIGSPFNKKAKEVNAFLKMHGFDSIQLGPPGLISKENVSPYSASVNSKNYLFADMNKLTSDNYGNILKPSDIEKKTSELYKESTQTDFNSAFKVYDSLFETAYDNLKNNKTDSSALKLKSEFNHFKKTSGDWLETDALFEVIRKKYNTSDIEKWPDMAKNLITYKNDPESPKHEKALELIAKLKETHGTEVQIFKFKQFIMDKQEKEFIKANPNKLNYISDAIIGFSTRDLWANQDSFLPGYRVGCPHGGPGNGSQMWDIPVLNPKTLFNEDGSLGSGGKLLRQKFEKLLDSYQNIRIDHAMGLVDPWIYNKDPNKVYIEYEDKDPTKGILFVDAHGDNLSHYGDFIEGNHNYRQALEKIILPLLKEKGLNPNDLVWEDLGEQSTVFDDIYNKKLKLPGLTSLMEFSAQSKAEEHPNNWFLITSHDNPPFAQIAGEGFLNVKNHEYWKDGEKITGPMSVPYLIGLLYPPTEAIKTKNKEKRLRTDDQTNILKGDLYGRNNTKFRVLTKYQELLRCAPKAQFSFMDFFGLDASYNNMGNSKDPNNWKLRLSRDYQADYYDKLVENKMDEKSEDGIKGGIALNMPELLKRAVISKLYTTNKPEEVKEQVEPLIEKLNYWKKILYLPEGAEEPEKP